MLFPAADRLVLISSAAHAQVLVLAPCALLAASGVKPMWTAGPLVIDMVYDSWNLILTQL